VRCVADELLKGRHFDTPRKAEVLIEDWRLDCITKRPRSTHGELTPDEFAEAHLTRTQPVLA